MLFSFLPGYPYRNSRTHIATFYFQTAIDHFFQSAADIGDAAMGMAAKVGHLLRPLYPDAIIHDGHYDIFRPFLCPNRNRTACFFV